MADGVAYRELFRILLLTLLQYKLKCYLKPPDLFAVKDQ